MNTPSAVLTALHPEAVHLGELVLPPYTIAKHTFLERIKCPLLVGEALEVDMLDMGRALVVMSRPIAETQALHANLTAFDAEAWRLLDLVPFATIQRLALLLVAHINTGFATAIPMKAPAAPGSGGKGDPFPGSPAAPADAAGCSSSSTTS